MSSEMKLSEAMRKGSECSTKTVETYFESLKAVVEQGIECKACAMGAALLGFNDCDVHKTYDKLCYASIVDLIAESIGFRLDIESVIHPFSNEADTLWSIIADLNDHRDLTREQIADWLESEGY